MPGPSRINFLSLFCSCVGQTVILGGIMYGLSDHHREKLGARDARAPLVVELIPLGVPEGASNSAVKMAHAARPVPAAAKDKRRAAPPLRGALPMALSSEPADSPASEARSEEGSREASNSPDFSDYQRRLYQALSRGSRYPAEARRLNLSGITRLAFKIDRTGKVLDSWIQESSGSELLDNAALEALERAQPLPPIPAGLPSRMDFVIEIDLSTMQQDAMQSAGRK